MKHSFIYIKAITFFFALAVLSGSCKKDSYSIPVAKTALQNDVIKRTLGPNIVGQQIEFAYAIAKAGSTNKIVSAQVEATFAGATGTFLENKSYYTKGNGQDTGVVIGSASVNDKAITSVTFTRDTNAVTLRYYYVIPEEARGKTVSFNFSAKSADGQVATFSMGPYTIAKMDMALNIPMRSLDSNYISISDLKVYTAANVAANASKIDLIYLYRALPTVNFAHALVSPAADTAYLPGVTLPAGVNKSTKLIKVFNLQDFNLAKLQYGIYIDDLDFQQLNFSTAPNYAINLKAESGAWVETGDGKYRAYIYFNSVDNANGKAVISIKRYPMN